MHVIVYIYQACTISYSYVRMYAYIENFKSYYSATYIVVSLKKYSLIIPYIIIIEFA